MRKKKPLAARIRKALIVFVAVIAVIVAVVAASNVILYKVNVSYAKSFDKVAYEQQKIPQTDEQGNTSFTSADDFKIMQLTDVHLGGGFLSFSKDRMALNAVAAMITAEKPDLVVVTGDLTYATPQAGSFNNKLGVVEFAELMDTLGVYWTLTLGNHDSESYSYYSREDVGEFYMDEKYTYCLFEIGDSEVDGVGNSVITVKNTDGVVTQALFMLDSHAYTKDDPLGVRWLYDNLHENQIEWYTRNVDALTLKNAELGETETVSSLVFMHIPLVEYRDAYNEYLAAGGDTENVKLVSGVIGEKEPYVYCGAGEDNFFESLNGTKAIFCGHDHLNNAHLEYKGVKLCYGMSVDYLAYIGISKKGDQRGCTVIESAGDGQIEITAHNYYEDVYEPKYEKETVVFNNAEG